MDKVRRMILVDPAVRPLHPEKERVDQDLKKRELYSLDKELLDIINNNELSSDTKVEQYNQTLAKYLDVHKSRRLPAIHDTRPALTNSAVKDNPIDQQLVVAPIPKVYQNKAKNLLNFLVSKDDFIMRADGALTIKDETVDDANITDLLNKAVNPKSKLQDNLVGWNAFKQYLIDRNSPKSLVGVNLDKIEDSITPQPSVIASSPISRPKKAGKISPHKKHRLLPY